MKSQTAKLVKQIFYGEFDGCRPKRIIVKIIGEIFEPVRRKGREDHS